MYAPLLLKSGRGGSWLSLADHPHVPDDTQLLDLFEDVAGITFLAEPGGGASAVGRGDGGGSSRNDQRSGHGHNRWV